MNQVPVIIPARAGSMGLKNKNLISICGKPLVEWSIIEALESECVSNVYVSTDGEDIAQVAREAGAIVVNRPKEISGDFATSEAAILHAMNYVEEEFEEIIFLQATSPLRVKGDIDNAYRKFKENGYDSLFSMSIMDDYTLWQGDPGKEMRSVNFDYLNRGRRQERRPIYLENGSIYIFKKDLIINTSNRMGGEIGVYEMPFSHSFEIDSIEEVEICEFYLKKILEEEKR